MLSSFSFAILCCSVGSVLQIWDAGTGQGFSQYTEHQKRAWSVDFSPSDPTKFVSGSDDCSVKLWSVNEVKLFFS